MRVQIVDPAAYTPPYDHALAGSLARAGAQVELVTCEFPYGSVPREPGYGVTELFYRRSSAAGSGNAKARRAIRAAEHVPGMLRHRRHARAADVVHYQWLPVPRLDDRLLADVHPRVFTMHWRFPEPGSRIAGTLASLLERMDGVVAHSRHGSERLVSQFGVDPGRIEVIPHGAFDYLTRQQNEEALPGDLSEAEGPVILAFGLIRPYKGTDVLLEAFAKMREDAELWIVGRPMVPMEPLRALADAAPGRVRFVERFVADTQVPALMRRADLVTLPYRNIEQSGVLYTALAFGRPLVLSAIGGFPEVAELGAARTVPPADPDALAAALDELIADPAERESLGAAALAAAETHYSWDEIGRRTLAFYERLLTIDR
ncbi:MAG: glycosyltransferase family 4 protein [Solirubrobacterales bacterium]|nr:glycosyltransferase family 4 protein [Solirubrobacterales bacterium]